MHFIEGLVASYTPLLAAKEQMAPDAEVAPLPQGMGFLVFDPWPTNNGDEFVDYNQYVIEDAPDLPPEKRSDYCTISDRLRDFAVHLSHSCPVVYVATAYAGGPGSQCAGLWDDGKQIEVPLWGNNNSIDATLLQIGVTRDKGLDEFDSIGLGWFRSNTAWIDFAKHPDAHNSKNMNEMEN